MTEWLEYFADGILDELYRVKKSLGAEMISLSTPETALNADQLKILDYLSKHGFMKDSDYAKLTDRAKATRTLDFKKLILLGHIVRLGQGKGSYYKLGNKPLKFF